MPLENRLEPQPCYRVPEAALDVSGARKTSLPNVVGPSPASRLHLRNHRVTPGNDGGRPRSSVGLTHRGSFKARPCPLPRSLCPRGMRREPEAEPEGACPEGLRFPEVALTQEPDGAGCRERPGSRAGQRVQERQETSTGPERAGGRGPGKLNITPVTTFRHGVWSAYCGQGAVPSTLHSFIHPFVHSSSLS